MMWPVTTSGTAESVKLLCQSAARGVNAVYAMSTPYEQGAEHETAQGLTITEAAQAAGVAHLIYSSVASANRATGIPHFDSKYEVEKHLQASGVPYTIVAPVYFMENLLEPWLVPGLRQGKLAMALPADLARVIIVAAPPKEPRRRMHMQLAREVLHAA